MFQNAHLCPLVANTYQKTNKQKNATWVYAIVYIKPLFNLIIGYVAGGNEALPLDHKENIPRTHAKQTVVWKDLFKKAAPAPGFQCSISVPITIKKVQQGQNKGQCLEFLFHN